MNRKEIITKLMSEGLSEKTLVIMSDKQLGMLSERMLGEQYGNQVVTPINIPKTDTNAINVAKQQKKQFVAYEGEIKEDEKLGEPEKKSESDKESIIKRIKFKIEHEKDKKKVEDFKKQLEKLEGGKKEVKEEEKPKFKSKTEWLKSKGIIKDDDKKETTESSDVADPEPDKKKTEKKDKTAKGEGGSEYEKRLATGNAGLSLNEWVSDIVKKHYHPFTSKGEIMELIQTKLTEQKTDSDVETLPDFLTGESIMKAGAAEPATKPTTKPGTKPTTKPTPKTPFQPGPGPKHNPKAKAKKESVHELKKGPTAMDIMMAADQRFVDKPKK